MPTYHYRARDRQGVVSEAEMEAANPSAVAAELRRQGMWATRIEVVTGSRPERWQSAIWHRVSPPATGVLGQFLAQLSSLLQSGINAHDAMSDLAERADDHRLRRAAAEMAEGLAHGSSLADQLTRYPNLFPPHVLGTAAAGESFGALPEALGTLATQLAAEAAMLARLRWLRIYYGAVLVLAVLVTPFPMMIARGMSWYLGLLLTRLAPALLGAVALLMLIRALLSLPALAGIRSRIALSLPLVGGLTRSTALVRFCTALRMSQRAGAGLDQGLMAAGRATGQATVARRAEAAGQMVAQGRGLADALPALGLLPRRVINMLAIGERAGRLEESLAEATAWAEERRERSVTAITAGAAGGALAVAAVVTAIAVGLAYRNYYEALIERIGPD